MNTFHFRVPPDPGAACLRFDLNARTAEEAVDKAKQLLEDNLGDDGLLHLDLDYGLMNGKLKIPMPAVTASAIVSVEVRDNPQAF